MASSPITSWQIDGEKMETVTEFIIIIIFWLQNHCGQWLQTWNNLDSLLKSKAVTLMTKVHLVKAMVFPVVMYWCESWTTKKACWAF